ncbi:uroporphyrinogen-III synthase [Herbaspirillum sp. RTI4]|uniref:uroporphyrinogen-III synthase n=1 Tax=Herbaspirillum sp. RTI4 TaxID=3048640 RepID=UPI002AB5BAB3|nr:uroporphyrinogen-III synthase [Herbaspirillum sp. RTI4]MDY7579467.1 uroporphyrinogen-III synthase [Herbaspirillum sp. RTI4]MEA9980381.1 uroporphyrinogen-III synthase [Herbaspirillum sp. RTI4]
MPKLFWRLAALNRCEASASIVTHSDIGDERLPLRPVVVTRPLAQAEAFAEQVRLAGYAPVLFPLLHILPASDPDALRAVLAGVADYALVVFVSPNAVEAAFQVLPGWPSDVAIGIVGEGSRATLARHGVHIGNTRIFSPPDEGKSDSEELFKSLDLVALNGRRVLIVRGEHGRDFLTQALRAQGIEVDHISAYRRLTMPLDASTASRLRGLLARDSCWVVTSSEALRHLLALAGTLGDAENVVKLQRKMLLVSHQRIAETAHALGFLKVRLTGSGDERLLAALQSVYE